MAPQVKVRAKVRSKSKEAKLDKRNDVMKIKRNKVPTTKTKDSKPITAPPGPLVSEESEKQPEPAGDDEHAFFDNEENADYARFMLSLDSSELKTFSKRAKDRVAVAPVSKKKLKRLAAQLSSPAQPERVVSVSETVSEKNALTVPDDISSVGDSGSRKDSEVLPMVAERPPQRSAPDAKRWRASTPGWVIEDTGPERLPIKTRGGLLKPNDRMRSQPSSSGGQKQTSGGTAATRSDGDGLGIAGDELCMDNGQEKSMLLDGSDEAADGDKVSDDEQSVYDSADSDLGDYSLGKEPGQDGVDSSADAHGVVGGGQARLSVLRQRRLEHKKALMAELCETILGSPEESLMRPKNVPKGEEDRSRIEQLFALVRVRSFFSS